MSVSTSGSYRSEFHFLRIGPNARPIYANINGDQLYYREEGEWRVSTFLSDIIFNRSAFIL